MSPLQHSTLQKNEHTLNGVCEQSNWQSVIVRWFSGPLIIRNRINAEWKIWNSVIHNPDTVWYRYCRFHLSSLRTWGGGICCAVPALMSKTKISCGKKFAGWTQEVHQSAGWECCPWTPQGNGQPAKNNLPRVQKKSAVGRWVPIKHSPFRTWGGLTVSSIFSLQTPWEGI